MPFNNFNLPHYKEAWEGALCSSCAEGYFSVGGDVHSLVYWPLDLRRIERDTHDVSGF